MPADGYVYGDNPPGSTEEERVRVVHLAVAVGSAPAAMWHVKELGEVAAANGTPPPGIAVAAAWLNYASKALGEPQPRFTS